MFSMQVRTGNPLVSATQAVQHMNGESIKGLWEIMLLGDRVISSVYYVEGLGHNVFFVGQFCDSDLEVDFRKHSCFVRNMEGVDLLKGCRSTISSSAVTTADASNKRQQPDSTSSTSTLATTVTADGNFDLFSTTVIAAFMSSDLVGFHNKLKLHTQAFKSSFNIMIVDSNLPHHSKSLKVNIRIINWGDC
ncbi:hypothetical protein Tco_1079130 [Tanacetum coccineum]|uniref:Integrase, catalytic region, zinc finger, CCHC-type, peptidase aspartic, catalytic n=1 Tax=Tanacetum coccineum TaxID=301880 RepID=A0ABQ5HSJ1_9ASTR